jgi:hypothetical protein
MLAAATEGMLARATGLLSYLLAEVLAVSVGSEALEAWVVSEVPAELEVWAALVESAAWVVLVE